jgi:hypothetical protein
MLGYYSYTVDQLKTFNDKKLGEIATLKDIPSFAGERDLNSAREIDVIWFGDDENPGDAQNFAPGQEAKSPR